MVVEDGGVGCEVGRVPGGLVWVELRSRRSIRLPYPPAQMWGRRGKERGIAYRL